MDGAIHFVTQTDGNVIIINTHGIQVEQLFHS